MSNFKRMKLVPENDIINDKTQKELLNVIRYDTPGNQRQMSDLDEDIKKILNSKLDENSKSKLYSQSLRRFLAFKRLHERESKTSTAKSSLTILPESTKTSGKKKKKKTERSKREVKSNLKLSSYNKSLKKQRKTTLPKELFLPTSSHTDNNNSWLDYD